MIFFAFAIAGIGLGRHDWSERCFGLQPPAQDVHQLRDFRRRIQLDDHKSLMSCRVAVKSQRTEPLDDFAIVGPGPSLGSTRSPTSIVG
jgi:hypothetical protein